MKTEKRDSQGVISSTKDVLAAIRGLKEDLTKCRVDIEGLTQERADFKSKLEREKSELWALREKFNELTKRKGEADQKIVTLETRLSESEGREKALEAELVEAKEVLDEIKEALEA